MVRSLFLSTEADEQTEFAAHRLRVMFFRFASALILVVLISMLGIRLEQETLSFKRAVSRQYYQTDLLLERHAQLRLVTQQLTAPSHLTELPTNSDNLTSSVSGSRRGGFPPESQSPSESPSQNKLTLRPQLPLLKFQQPFDPEGID